jgi:hypothetical protein
MYPSWYRFTIDNGLEFTGHKNITLIYATGFQFTEDNNIVLIYSSFYSNIIRPGLIFDVQRHKSNTQDQYDQLVSLIQSEQTTH